MFFEKTNIANVAGEKINPATDESLSLLRRIFMLLKPLGVITGNGSNRLSVDANVVGTVSTVSGVTTVTTVTTVSTVANQTNVASINAFEMMKAINRSGYNTGVRANIT